MVSSVGSSNEIGIDTGSEIFRLIRFTDEARQAFLMVSFRRWRSQTDSIVILSLSLSLSRCPLLMAIVYNIL